MLRCVCLLAVFLCASNALAQDAELPPERYDALAGLYEFEDGRLLEIFDLVDQMRQNQLTAVEFGSGRLRTLYPASSTEFSAGPAWFARSPTSYTLTFTDGADGQPEAVTWIEGDTVTQGLKVQFEEREVTFENGDVTLSGTVILPPPARGFSAPHPAMVMVHGSGPLTRRGQRYVAELFAYHGFAVLVHDKRGVGESTGSWNALAHTVWADDIRAAVDTLRAQPGIDPEQVGLFASSEGGYVAPQVAATDDALAFFVCRVCASLPHNEVILDMEGGAMRRQGYADADIELAITYLGLQMAYALDPQPEALEQMRALFAEHEGARWITDYTIRLHQPDAPFWTTYRGVLEPAPAPIYATLDLPILIVLGERDNRILAEPNVAAYEVARSAAGNDDFTIRVLPNATHGLMEIPTTEDGQPGDFDRYVPGFHLELVEWVLNRVGRTGGR
ncbi:MAG: hypothetical protein Rubg2KO_37000 [Rubricoccaceae bacterium]